MRGSDHRQSVLAPPEVHNAQDRLDLESLLDGQGAMRQPSPLIRTGGYLLLWTIAVVVCYSAAL